VEEGNRKGSVRVLGPERVADLDTPVVAHFLSIKVIFLESGGSVRKPQVLPVRASERTVSKRKQR
jgi:hypothetical protein